MAKRKRKEKGYRLALRPMGDDVDGRDPDEMDDVVVNDVSCFRAEIMDDRNLWMCCYLDGTGVEQDRVTFNVRAHRSRLIFTLTETPTGRVTYEEPRKT